MATETINIIIQERGGRRVSGVIRGIGADSTKSAGGVQLLRNALRGLGASFAIREVLRAVDSYQRMQNQLRVVGYETNQLAAAQNRLFEIAQRTRVPLEDTVNLYGKLAQSAGELGKSQDEMMRFTELTGKALAIQGTSTQGSRAALLQLSQAMGEGIVRAQEYNSLIENARPLLMAAAKGMDGAGGSVARLRTMVLDGTVTSTAFFEAVLKGGELLDEQFGKTVPTIGQALTKLRNAFVQFMGESAAGQAILAGLSGVLILIADNFTAIATTAATAGAAFALYWGAATLTSAVTVVWGAVKAQQALNIALGATGRSAGVAAAGLKFVQVGVRALTVAIAANPLGALLVAALALGAYLYTLKDNLVTIGDTTATLGSIVSVVWDNALGYVKTFIDNTRTWFSGWFTKVSDWFAGIFAAGRTMANFLIAVVKSMVDIWVGEFKVLYDVAIGVFSGIAASGRDVFDGLAAAITGDFSAAGAAFSSAFSTENFQFDAAVETARGVATTVGENFGRDFITEAGGAISDGRATLVRTVETLFDGVIEEAAARDALANIEVPEFEFITPPGVAAGSAAGSGAADLTAVQERLKDIIDDVTEATAAAAVEQEALNLAFEQGYLTEEQYAVGLQKVRMFEAAAALEGINLASAIRETNEAILELKISSGTGSFADGFLLGLSRMTEGAMNFTANAGSLFADFFSDFTDGFANSIGRAIVYSEDLGEALQNVANEALASLISGLVKMGIQWLLNAAIGQSVGAAATVATVAQASVASAAWAGPAALASLATSGANAAPANAAVATTIATTQALAAAFANGGQVSGPGGPRDDKILAKLSDGEFVVNAQSTKENLAILEMINAGVSLKNMLPKFADGGQAVVGVKPTGSSRLAMSAASDTRTLERSNTKGGAQAAPEVVVPVAITNISDPEAAVAALQSDAGERSILNVIKSNPETIKAILR